MKQASSTTNTNSKKTTRDMRGKACNGKHAMASMQGKAYHFIFEFETIIIVPSISLWMQHHQLQSR